MDEREYNNVYAIPANYTDSGKLLGGMIDTRNAIETVILVLALGYAVENEAGKGFINHALKGSLKIIKTTSDGKKEGFAFRITGANGYDMTFTTDAKGEIFIEKLRIGEYNVTELKNSASEGYKIADPVKITLVANETLTVKIHNDKTKVDVPKTGDDADLMLWISLLGLAAAGVGCTAFFYLKKRRTGKHVAVKK